MNNWATRSLILLFLCCVNFIYSKAVADVDAFPYNYIFAAIFEIIIILCLSNFGKNAIVRDVQKIGLWLAITHLYGFAIYKAGFYPDSYDNLQIVLNFMQFARLLWTGKHDGDIDNYFNADRFCSAFFNRLGSHSKE